MGCCAGSVARCIDVIALFNSKSPKPFWFGAFFCAVISRGLLKRLKRLKRLLRGSYCRAPPSAPPSPSLLRDGGIGLACGVCISSLSLAWMCLFRITRRRLNSPPAAYQMHIPTAAVTAGKRRPTQGQAGNSQSTRSWTQKGSTRAATRSNAPLTTAGRIEGARRIHIRHYPPIAAVSRCATGACWRALSPANAAKVARSRSP